MSNIEAKELQKLIDINTDACEFYESAQDKADNPELKATFRSLESLHKSVVSDLQTRVLAKAGDKEASETMTGKATRFWGELIASVSNDVDETLVKHLEEAEDRCLHSMQDAIDNDELLPGTKDLLRKELTTLKKSHDYMKDLKDYMMAA